MNAASAIAGCILLALSCQHALAEDASPEALFSEAVNLMEAGQFAEAVPILESLTATHPTATVYWNLGLATAEIGANDKALQAWRAFRLAAPDDWRGRTKLIQTYQALGDAVSRDRERSLLELWRSEKDAALSEELLYCREELRVVNQKVFALEYFDPGGEWMVFYSFVVATGPDAKKVKVSLGSYQMTNQIAWESGIIPRDRRVYHLDFYAPNRHETHGFYHELPAYEEVRAKAIAILSGASKPTSSMTTEN